METSLCVILPIRNAEHRIADQLLELLEILPDLTSRFEILVVDNASTDQTEEIAQDLAQTFPQIGVTRQRAESGLQEAANVGLAETNADIVFVHESRSRVSHTQLRRLWAARNDDTLTTIQTLPEPKPIPGSVIEGLVKWGMDLTEMDASSADTSGLQMIRRQAVQQAPEPKDGEFSRTDGPQEGPSEPQPWGVNSRPMRRGLARVPRPAE